MRIFLFAFTALAVLCLAAPRAGAWNATGHMAVASLAYDHLSPKTKAAVNMLLQRHRDYAHWINLMPAGYADRARFAFMKAATWPDDIRGTPDDRPTWHYVDRPVVVSGDKPDPASLAVPTPNAETQIPIETKLLTDKTTADAERATALCWVEHLVGDIHQPLHDAAYFSPLFPQGDRGGNDETLSVRVDIPNGLSTANSRPEKLHALWDALLGQTQDPTQIQALAAGLEMPAYARKTFPQLTAHKSVADWVGEGNTLARDNAYENGRLAMTQTGASQAEVILPPGYLDTARQIARRQIALAAWRLADLLNAQTFPAVSKAAPPTVAPPIAAVPTTASGPFIGNRHTHVVHPPGDTRTLPAESNRVYFQTLDEAQKAGYHLP